MKSLKWRDPTIVESSHTDYLKSNHDDYLINIPGRPRRRNLRFEPLRDSSILYYKMAIDHDPKEFHFLKDLILFMYNLPENKDEELQQLIISKLQNYSTKEKKRLKKISC